MKEYIKIFSKWIIFAFGMSVFFWIWYLLIRARSSSSSWLTVDSSSPASIYVGAGETLTAAKRNRLVQKSNREDVPSTDTAPFDTNCERKCSSSLLTRVETTQAYYLHTNGYRYINYANKSKRTNWQAVSWIQKKCQ